MVSLKNSDEELGAPVVADVYARFALQTAASMKEVLRRAQTQKIYDLSVDYFVGMPHLASSGDPPFQIWMTHTPNGTVVDDARGHGPIANELISYSGDAILMYTHTGTHIDSLNHFGCHGTVRGGHSAERYLGSRSWTVNGAELIPPVVARGVLIDIAASEGMQMLPDSFRIDREVLQRGLAFVGVTLQSGDVVVIRTGRMRIWNKGTAYASAPPGLTREGAMFLAERGAMVIGTDAISIEQMPSLELPANPNPVHTYLLHEVGIPIIEVLHLEELANDAVYEFAFLASNIRLRGATAAPLRPFAFPMAPSLAGGDPDLAGVPTISIQGA